MIKSKYFLHFALIFIISIFSLSCDKNKISSSSKDIELSFDNFIDKDIIPISIKDAQKVANLFIKSNYNLHKFDTSKVLIYKHNNDRDNKNKGYAWVCEGFHDDRFEAIISTIVDLKFNLDNAGDKYSDYKFYINNPNTSSLNSPYYFYMNMRGGGYLDGWYKTNMNGNNYYKNKKMMTI